MKLTSLLRYLVLQLFFFLIIFLNQGDAFAQINVKVNSVAGIPDQTVDVPIELSGSAPNGITAFDFRLTYDNTRLTPLDMTPASPGALGAGGIILGSLPAGSTVGDEDAKSSLYIQYS